MRIGLKLVFKRGAIDGKSYLRLYDQFIRFVPYSFTKRYKSYPWDEAKHRKSIERTDAHTTLIISNLNYETLFMSETGGVSVPCQVVDIVEDESYFFPSNSDLHNLVSHPQLVNAYVYHSEYEIIQSEKYSTNFNHREFTSDLWESLKHTPWKSDGTGGIEYDVRYNPGRSGVISGAWLMAAWKMWFGKPFFELVPKDRILSFPEAIEIKDLDEGGVYVHLFQRIEESASIENMKMQQKWRDWLRYDDLVAKYK